jgi:hypothetical protein
MAPPAFRVCPFCSEMFGSASLRIHEKRCRLRPAVRAPSAPPIAPPTERPLPDSPTATAAAESCYEVAPDANTPTGPLQPCRHCGRTFHPSRIAVHERVCIKSKQREKSASPAARRPAPKVVRLSTRTPTSKWRQQHEALMAVARANRGPARSPGTLRQRGTKHHAMLLGSPNMNSLSSLTDFSALRRTGLLSNMASAADIRESAPRASVSGRSSSGAGVRRGGSSEAPRRPTAAQRHAQQWHQSQQREPAPQPFAVVHRVTSSPSRTPPKQLLERARGRAGAFSSFEPAAPTFGEPSSPLSSAACGAFHQSNMPWAPSVNPSMTEARAGYSPPRPLGMSSSRGGGLAARS